MIDKIPYLGDSWLGKLIAYIVLVFIYYFLWMALTMILLNKTTKHAYLYGELSVAKKSARGLVMLFLIFGFNMAMYAVGLYKPPTDVTFLFLLSMLFTFMIMSMIDIMGKKFSGGEEFYDTIITFILTVGFLSPSAGLLTLGLFDKLYLLGGLLVNSFLFTFKFVNDWAGNITSKVINYMARNIKIK
ncbi:hypothetical protein HYX02_04920 [Candidatus Woesearchaeota archaeon]|nr:hypothetical protein [Candidatus Woesearchaeota archaeon]